MPATAELVRSLLTAALPYLAFLGSFAGAGVLASRAFDRLRTRFRRPAELPSGLAQRLFYQALYAPRYSFLANLVLAGLISVACSVVLAGVQAWLLGAPILAVLPSALDAALAAALAAIVSQVRHRYAALSPELPGPSAINTRLAVFGRREPRV